MRKVKLFIVFVFCLFSFPLSYRAKCDYHRMSELNKMAGNVRISYTYEPKDDGLLYTVYLNNLVNDIYIIDDEGNIISGVGERTFNYTYGGKIKYVIYSADPNCYGNELTTRYFKLPSYNKYYNRPECVKNPDFKFCDLWGVTATSDGEFNGEYEQYINSKGSSSAIEEDDDFSFNYLYLFVLIVVVILAGVFMIIFVSKKKKVKLS